MPRQQNEQDLRRKQIDTLKVFNENVVEVKNNEIYEVSFKLKVDKSELKAKVVILLPGNFPLEEKPKLVIQPVLAHSYLNRNGEVVSFPGLANFTAQHSDIGRIVQAIISDFEKNPPAVLDLGRHQNHTAFHDFNLRKELESLDLDQLSQLMKDPTYFDDFVEETKVVRTHTEALETLFNEVENISRENLEKEEMVSTLQQKVQEISSEFLELGAKYEASSQQYQKKCEEYSPTNIKELLSIATSNAESDCENSTSKFLQGDCNLQTFLTDFLEAKRLFALRKFKEERLSYQLEQLRLQ